MFPAIQTLSDLTDRLNQIRAVSTVLLENDPNESARDLVTVLAEVNKTFSAFETVLVSYLSLRFIPATRDKDEVELVKLQGGGKVLRLVGEMRARCSKIGLLYDASLEDWFAHAPIDGADREALGDLFRELEDSDANAIIPAVNELATWLSAEVDATSTLVNAGQFDRAGERVLQARRSIAPLRRTLARVSGDLRDLEIQFTS